MKKAVLVIDDLPDDVQELKLTLRSAGLVNAISVVSNVDEAVNYWTGKGVFSNRERYPIPSIILISLQLPECAALQFLHWLREQPEAKSVLLLALVERAQLKTVVRAYDFGAHSFLVKPVNGEDLRNVARSFPVHWENV